MADPVRAYLDVRGSGLVAKWEAAGDELGLRASWEADGGELGARWGLAGDWYGARRKPAGWEPRGGTMLGPASNQLETSWGPVGSKLDPSQCCQALGISS